MAAGQRADHEAFRRATIATLGYAASLDFSFRSLDRRVSVSSSMFRNGASTDYAPWSGAGPNEGSRLTST
jgi:hypothetical protein